MSTAYQANLRVGDVVLRETDGASIVGRVVAEEPRLDSIPAIGPAIWAHWVKIKLTHEVPGRNKNKARWNKSSMWRRISPLEQLACCADEIDKLPKTGNQ